ncbi:MAG: hypothetical protein JWL64_2779, partial [Frankiales bacterium]|nr:hypothetical protein [Frankiales bacterium]
DLCREALEIATVVATVAEALIVVDGSLAVPR